MIPLDTVEYYPWSPESLVKFSILPNPWFVKSATGRAARHSYHRLLPSHAFTKSQQIHRNSLHLQRPCWHPQPLCGDRGLDTQRRQKVITWNFPTYHIPICVPICIPSVYPCLSDAMRPTAWSPAVKQRKLGSTSACGIIKRHSTLFSHVSIQPPKKATCSSFCKATILRCV